MSKLWVCGKTIEVVSSGVVWELQGIFSTEALATDNCTAYNYFIGEVDVDKALPDLTTTWDSCYYPCDKGLSVLSL